MRKLKFQDIDNPTYLQQSLFLPPSVSGTGDFPPILHTAEGVKQILADASEGIGLDLEFDPKSGKPSILGVANKRMTSGVRWDRNLAQLVVDTAISTGVPIVGYSVIGADRPILEKALGIKTPRSLWLDSMIRMYLNNQELCKTPGKEEDEGDSGAMGFLSLWTFASLYTDYPAWKTCRGKACEGPCPLHDPFSYCAVDAMAGLVGDFPAREEMAQKKIPQSLFDDLHELSEVTTLMQERGVKVNMNYVRQMSKDFDAEKLEIFPVEIVKGKPVYNLFNPKSPSQVHDYFASKGIELRDTDKTTVKKVLEKEAKRRGYTLESLGNIDSLPEELDALHRLYTFKEAGKGIQSWFDARYLDKHDLAHARFIPTGTSTGRLASSSPNLQNVPARGFGSRIREAIIPRDPSLKLWKMDFSQLELRICLYLAGVDPKEIDADAFMYLVRQSGDLFDRAAANFHMTGRDIAKSISHGANYLEGITILTDKDIERRKKEIEEGALRLYPNWHLGNGTVAFTGANLAERLFGDKTRESRKKAHEIQEDIYFKMFPMIRQWQQKVTEESDAAGYVRSVVGRYLPLRGSLEDNAKLAVAFNGQGTGSDFVIGKVLQYYREYQSVPLLLVHDEAVIEVPREWDLAKAKDWYALMKEETPVLPGFVCPFKCKEGPNWGQMTALSL